MKTKVIGTKAKQRSQEIVKGILSIKTFVDYLKKRIVNEQTIKSEFYRFVLKKIAKYDELGGGGVISMDNIKKYTNIFELIYAALTTATESNSKFS